MADIVIGVGFTILAALSLAVQSLTVRLGTKTHRVSEVIAIIFIVNLIILIPVVGILTYPQYNVTLTAVGAFAIAGLLGSLVARYCYFFGIARLGASRAEPLKALFPVIAVGIAVFLLNERVTMLLLSGIGLLVIGGLGVGGETRASPVTATGKRVWLDMAFPLSAAVLLGIDPIFTKLGLAEGTSPLIGLVIRILAAAGGFGIYVVWRRMWTESTLSLSLNRWLLAASVANTGYLLAYYLALSQAPVSIVTPLLGLSTLFVIAGAAIFLQSDEQVTWRLGTAAILIIVGSVFVII